MTAITQTEESFVSFILATLHVGVEITPAKIEAQVDELRVGPWQTMIPDRETIINEVLRRISVRVGAATTLDANDEDHQEWLPTLNKSRWRFWPRFQWHLQNKNHLPPAILQTLDQSTDQVLERLESPDRTGAWDRRGLVVGHVQSGKTTHYTALAAKALDAGYQIIIVLAGIHNSLRSQTHERIDKHLIGRDSAALIEAAKSGNLASTVPLGVGEDDHLQGRGQLPVTILTCTSSTETGDFRKQIANQIGFQVSSGTRLVMVVKKNVTILRNLIGWLVELQRLPGQIKIDAPALIIDDEADHASVNTSRDPDDDPTTTNRLIRSMLQAFYRVGFVGYTATPFANIFISSEADHNQYGDDLFPRSFIVNLQPPSDYVGPNTVFGHAGDESAGVPEQPPLPMHRNIGDSPAWLPDKHKKDHTPGKLPETLHEAVRAFLLVCAARAVRGDIDVHNSMLVHATRFVNVQERIYQQLNNEMVALRNAICSSSQNKVAQTRSELQQIWTTIFVEKHIIFRERLDERCLDLPNWDQVWEQIPNAVKRIELMRINGTSSDTLTYSRKPKGIYVIAIGGDKLSRGLTLEGLSISYFLRASKMFDTLLQMGRWFGYRQGYIDLCRVYTTNELYTAFREIALAFDELRSDLDQMARANYTPMKFGMRMRTPTDGLLITAANKIRNGERVAVRFADSLVQVLDVQRTGQKADAIRTATKKFLASIPTWERKVRDRESSHYLWRGTDNVAKILEFLGRYDAFATPSFSNYCEALRRFIQDQAAKGELIDWTVAVISKVSSSGVVISDILSIPRVERSKDVSESWNNERFTTKAAVGSADEAIDLTKEEYLTACQESAESPDNIPTTPSRDKIREIRPAKRGLLLIYLVEDKSDPVTRVEFIPLIALSFPDSDTAQPLEYTVNDIWRKQFDLVQEDTDADVT